MRLTRVFLLSLVALAAVACDDDDDDGTGPEQFASVRVVNATNNTNDVNLFLGTSTTGLLTSGSELDARQSSALCVEVPAGSQTLNFRSGTTTLATAQNVTFQAGQRYTMFLSRNGANNVATVLQDNATPGASENAIRAFNASATPGDVYVFTSGGAMGTAAWQNLAVVGTTGAAAPTFVNRATTQNTIRLFNAGTSTGTPRAELTLPNFGTNRTGTVVFVEAGTPAGPTAFAVQSCP